MSNYGDQFMTCPRCGAQTESMCEDVGVGLYIKGDFYCSACGWEIDGPEDCGFLTIDDVQTLPIEAYCGQED